MTGGLWAELVGRFRRLFPFPRASAGQEFGAYPAISPKAEDDIALWYAMLIGQPPWRTREVIPVGLPGAICREMARLTLVELEIQIAGGPMGDFLMEQMRRALPSLLPALELFLALGGGAFKPCPLKGCLRVGYSGMTAFQPTLFNAVGECVGGVFREVLQKGKRWYIRLENHLLEGGDYTIQNKAFESDPSGTVGNAVALETVDEWAELSPETRIENLDRPLFAYFRTPVANQNDPFGRVGASVYAGAAAELIRQADVQWERIQWEFKSGERKIFGDGSQVNMEKFGKDRLFAFGPFLPNEAGELYHEFSPALRDSNLYAGFQNTLKLLEFNVGLSYGTISDPQSVEKTATEIEAGKQRMFTTIEGIKRSLQDALDGLIYAMQVYAQLYGLAPAGEYTVDYQWGDSILEDTAAKQALLSDMRSDVAAGLLRPEIYLAQKYGVTEEEALAMMPEPEPADPPQAEVE